MTDAAERVTLAEVAAKSGVSLSTISKVLNGRSDVSSETKKRVEEELARQGYHRRAKPESSAPFIELVFHGLDTEWSVEVIRGVEAVAAANGLSLVLTNGGSLGTPAEEWIEGLLQRRPVGAVLVFADLDEESRERLRRRSIPFVIVDPAGDPAPDVPAVGSANWAGGLAATRHLIELGHTQIAVISGPEEMMCSRARVDGFRSAMSVAEIPVREDWVRFGNFHIEGGRTHGRELLTAEDRPTAIFAGNDLQALGVLDTARDLGLRVPEDLSIVGYDDIPVATWVHPAFTTVFQPLRKMGEEAAKLVIGLWRGEDLDPASRIDLATSLVVRESTAPPAHTKVGAA